MDYKKERKKVVKELDRVFSEFIRARDKYTCITCGKVGSEKDGIMQNGHLFSRIAYSTRWDELNSACQCKSCNFSHEYDFEPYRQAFVNKYGQDKYDSLYRKHKTPLKISTVDLLVLTSYYKQKLKEMKNDF